MHGNRLMLVIAVVAGVLATVLAFTYISKAKTELEPEPERKVEVLVVKSDLAANHVLDPSDFSRPSRNTASGPIGNTCMPRWRPCCGCKSPRHRCWPAPQWPSRMLNPTPARNAPR